MLAGNILKIGVGAGFEISTTLVGGCHTRHQLVYSAEVILYIAWTVFAILLHMYVVLSWLAVVQFDAYKMCKIATQYPLFAS